MASTPPPEPLVDRRARLAAAAPDGTAFAAAWRATVDHWLAARFAVATDGTEAGAGLALVAVGGYGRGDLAPGSDLDLLLLHTDRLPPAAVAEALWYPIWDEGLKLGHAVRTPADALTLAADDLDTATALLSCRHLAGDPDLTARLAADAATQWRTRPRRLLDRLHDRVVARHQRVGEVAFLLEPDLKEGRGGLRDIQALRWVQAARAILDADELDGLADAERILFDARVALHEVTGRPQDQLRLEDQDAVAARRGTDADTLVADVARAARRVAWVADDGWDRLRATLTPPRSLLGWRSRSAAPGVVVRDGQVALEPSTDPATRPNVVFVAAAVARRTGTRIGRTTLLRLADRLPSPPDPWPDALRADVVDLLAGGRPSVAVIEALDHVGVWGRYLPEWDAVRSRPQRNAAHRFTVDRHLLETVVHASALTDRVDRPDLLLWAALLHDVGKGQPGDHSAAGAALADAALRRMGLPAADRAVVTDLIRLHLLLPAVATGRDLADPVTIATVAAQVGDRPRLALLAALTEADALATGPAAWSPWKAGLVAELVARVDHVLAGGTGPAPTVVPFPDAALRATAAAGHRTVTFVDDVVTVVAPDRRGLLARVAGALALSGLTVRSGEAAAVDAMAVERFVVAADRGLVVDRDRVVARVEAAVAGRLAIEARLAERDRTGGRRRPAVGVPPPSVRFDDGASGAATVVEVQAEDRPGLLYRVAATLADLDLDVATVKVQTHGDLVVDAFYVTHPDGAVRHEDRYRAEVVRGLLHAVR